MWPILNQSFPRVLILVLLPVRGGLLAQLQLGIPQCTSAVQMIHSVVLFLKWAWPVPSGPGPLHCSEMGAGSELTKSTVKPTGSISTIRLNFHPAETEKSEGTREGVKVVH